MLHQQKHGAPRAPYAPKFKCATSIKISNMDFHFCNGESSIIVGTACQQNNLFYFLKRYFRKI